MRSYNNIIVTTGDLKQHYNTIGPVYFQVSNKRFFSSALDKLVKKYSADGFQFFYLQMYGTAVKFK